MKRVWRQVVPSDKTRGGRNKMKYRKFPLSIRKYFTVRETEHWHRLPRQVAEFLFLAIFKGYLTTVLDKWTTQEGCS